MSKGSRRRPTNETAFGNNYEAIFGKNNKVQRGRFVWDKERKTFVPYEEYDKPIVGRIGPMIMGDIPAYVSPVSLKLIDGRKQQREDLKRHHCRIAEPSEKKDFTRPPPERDVNWK